MMFKRNRESTSEASNDPLDTDEQEKIISELRDQATKQADWTKKAFFYLYIIIAIGFAIMSVITILSPWEISHQSVFKELIAIEVFEIYYALSSINAAVLAFAIKDANLRRGDWRIICIATLSLGMLLFWGYLFHSLGVTNPQLIWIPLQGIAMALLAYYVRSDIQSLTQSVTTLENSKYEFKKI